MANNRLLLINFIFLLSIIGSMNCSIEKSLNSLGISLLKQIYQDNDGKENIFISPLSISSTLAMLYHGSQSQTREELTNTLDYNTIDENQVKNRWKTLQENILRSNTGYSISLANGIFASNKYDILENYEELLKTYYNASAEVLNFGERESLKKVNNWVKDRTNGKIDKLFDDLDSQTKLLLINAVYFKGEWNKPFLKEDTKNLLFKNFGFKDTSVPTMSLENTKLKYVSYDKLNLEIIEIPYKGQQLDMYIILPKVGDYQSMTELLESLTVETLEIMLRSMKKEDCNLWLPKFKTESKYKLKSDLTQIGIGSIFLSSADFSAINGNKGLYVSSFIHKSVIDVNEEGTEAAAASGVEIMLFSAMISETIDFRVNRPFIYLIRHKENGVIVFIGIVNKLK